MYSEMILDNDDIIDAMGDAEVQVIVDLLKVKKNPLYLEILCNLCECSESAKISHQNRIVKMLLEESKSVIYPTKLVPDGSDVLIAPFANDWQSLRAFCTSGLSENPKEGSREFKFFRAQIELYGKLALERNQYAIDVICDDTLPALVTRVVKEVWALK